MSKNCWFCGEKISFLNAAYINGEAVCDDCVRAYDLINSSESAEDLREKSAAMISRIQNNPKAVKLIEEKVNRFSKAFAGVEENKRKRLEEEQERVLKKQEQERIKQEQKRIKQEQERIKQEMTDEFLMKNGHEGYYEYKVLNILDEKSGYVNIEEINNQLNFLGRQGWHLRCAFTNELGKNASSIGIAGVSLGTNSTHDQSVLILERFIKFKS